MARYWPLLALVTLAGCAKPPDQIQPMEVSSEAFVGMACPQLIEQRQAGDAAVQQLSLDQKAAAQTDAHGVLWLGLPVASMSGRDREPTLAYAMGRLAAIDRAMIRKNCRLPGAAGD